MEKPSPCPDIFGAKIHPLAVAFERKISMDFKNVGIKYRPIPFWSWNEKLETEETQAQIGQMKEAGLGGFFMHARGGLETEYLSREK